MGIKVLIEDSGRGFSFEDDPGIYRMWYATDIASGENFILFSRSEMHHSERAISKPIPIDAFPQLRADQMDELLGDLRAHFAKGDKF